MADGRAGDSGAGAAEQPKGWGGPRPGSGRKPGTPGARKRKPKAKPQTVAAPKPMQMPAFEDVQRIIEMSEKHARQVERTPARNPFQLPVFPKHAMPPKRLQMAQDSGLSANLAWCGNDWLAGGQFTANIGEGLLFLGYPFLAELAQRPEYRIISETIATEATRKWIKFQATAEARKKENKSGKSDGEDRAPGPLDHEDEPIEPTDRERDGESDQESEAQEKANRKKADRIKQLNDEMERLHVRDRFTDLATQDGFFGRSHLYINFGEDIDSRENEGELKTAVGNGRDELSKGKLAGKKIEGIKTIEPVWTYPMGYNAQNPLSPNWYKPEYWFVMGREIHRSRLMTFIARPVPDMLKPAYAFGGLSLSQIAKPSVDIWLKTRTSVGELIHSYSVMVLMTDLATMLSPGSAGALMSRVALFNALRDNQGTFLVNKNTEDFKNVAATLSGLDHLQAQAQEHCASIARIPLVKFTGIQPTGLNATSDGEIRVWYDTVAAFQEYYFRPNLTTLIDFIMLGLWGEVDPEIGFEFVPLWSMTEKEQAEKQKIEAERNQIYVDTGIISPEEVRKVAIDDATLPFTALDPEDVPELREEEMGGLVPPGAGKGLEAVLGEGEEKPEKKPAAGERGGEDATILPFGDSNSSEWREGDHPRAPDGTFGSGGTGSPHANKSGTFKSSGTGNLLKQGFKPLKRAGGTDFTGALQVAWSHAIATGKPATVLTTGRGGLTILRPGDKIPYNAPHVCVDKNGNVAKFEPDLGPEAKDSDWNEGDHPRGQPGNAGQFGPGGGGSSGSKKKPTGEPGSGGTEPSTSKGSGEEPAYRSKKEHAAALLERGTTAKEMMAALGWPSISMPATAKSVGMKLEKVKEGGITRYKGVLMSDAELKAAGLMPPGIRRSGGPRARPKETYSLFEFIANAGGIKATDANIGDVRAVFGTKNKFVPGFGSLIRPKGMTLDKMREAAVEAGYFHDKGAESGGLATSDFAQILDAMDQEERGDKVYRFGIEAPEHVLEARRQKTQEESQHYIDGEIDHAIAELGIGGLSDRQRARVQQIMEKEGVSDALEAIEREAMEWVTDASDKGTAERILDEIPGWDVPDDAGAAPQPGGTAIPF